MKILEFIFTNVSIRTYTISATIIFTALIYFIVVFLIKFYSEPDNNHKDKQKQVHIIIKIFVFLFSLFAGFVVTQTLAELYFYRDWECSLRASCL